jgi:hypothetical protein
MKNKVHLDYTHSEEMSQREGNNEMDALEFELRRVFPRKRDLGRGWATEDRLNSTEKGDYRN